MIEKFTGTAGDYFNKIGVLPIDANTWFIILLTAILLYVIIRR